MRVSGEECQNSEGPHRGEDGISARQRRAPVYFIRKKGYECYVLTQTRSCGLRSRDQAAFHKRTLIRLFPPYELRRSEDSDSYE